MLGTKLEHLEGAMPLRSADAISERLYFRDIHHGPLPNPDDDFPLFFEFEAERTAAWEHMFSFPFFVPLVASPFEKILLGNQKAFEFFRHDGRAFTPPPTEVISNAATQFRRSEQQLRSLHQRWNVDDPIPANGDHPWKVHRDAINALARENVTFFYSLNVAVGAQHLLLEHGLRCIEPCPSQPTNDDEAEFDEVLGVSPAFHRETIPAINRRLNRALRLRNQIAERHLRLVIWVVNAVAARIEHMDRMNLISEGNTGLLAAIDRFDARRGNHFGTYAVWWIRQAILKCIKDQLRTIRIPVHRYGIAQRVERARANLLAEGHRPPLALELIADRAGLDVEHVAKILRLPVAQNILDWRVAEDDEGGLSEVIADPNATQPDEEAMAEILRETLDQILQQHLTPREREVIRRYYGFNDGRRETLKQIGDSVALTRERIRQIKEKALEKLAPPTRKFVS